MTSEQEEAPFADWRSKKWESNVIGSVVVPAGYRIIIRKESGQTEEDAIQEIVNKWDVSESDIEKL
jgi:hypothetical protein